MHGPVDGSVCVKQCARQLNVLNSAVSNACVPESYGPVCCAMQEVVSSQPSQKGHTEAQVRNNAESHTRNNAAAARFFNSRGY